MQTVRPPIFFPGKSQPFNSGLATCGRGYEQSVLGPFGREVTVSDSLDASKITTASVTVNVKNLNEAPVYTLKDRYNAVVLISKGAASISLDENIPGNLTKNGLLVATLTADDQDQLSSSLKYQTDAKGTASIVYDATGAFTYNAFNGDIRIANASKINFEASKTIKLTFIVTDDPISGDASSKAISTKLNVTIALNDLNEAPLISSGASVDILENNKAGASILQVKAADQDKGATTKFPVAYSIQSQKDAVGRDVAIFSIDPSTRKLIVPVAGALDHESSRFYALIVRATDGGSSNLYSQQTLTVNVTNVNEAATFALKDKNGTLVPPVNNVLSLDVVRATAVSNSTVIGNLSIADQDSGDAGTYTAGSITAAIVRASRGALTYNETTGDLIVLDKTKLKSGKIIALITDKLAIKPLTSKFTFSLNVG